MKKEEENPLKSKLEKTKHKYVHRSLDGKTRKLPVFKTAKGKYVVFVNSKKKYVDANKLKQVGGVGTPPCETDMLKSLIVILEGIPQYFEKKYLDNISCTNKRGGAPLQNEVSLRNFMGHEWSNRTQEVHFTNIAYKEELLRLVGYVFLLFSSVYIAWNLELVYLFFNPQVKPDSYNTMKYLHQFVMDTTDIPGASRTNVSNPFERFQIETYYNQLNIMHKNGNANVKETIIASMTSIFFIFVSIIQSFKIFIKVLKDMLIYKETSYTNKYIVTLLEKIQKKIVEDNKGNVSQDESNLALKIRNAKYLRTLKGLDTVFHLYSLEDIKDIESFKNFADTVDKEIKNYVDEKYQLVDQPDDGIVVGVVCDRLTDNQEKSEYEKISRLLHAMHRAQRALLISRHDPQETHDRDDYNISNYEYTAAELNTKVLTEFRETYKEIMGVEIEYVLDKNMNYITYRVKNQPQPGGSRRSGKTKGTKKRSMKKKI